MWLTWPMWTHHYEWNYWKTFCDDCSLVRFHCQTVSPEDVLNVQIGLNTTAIGWSPLCYGVPWIIRFHVTKLQSAKFLIWFRIYVNTEAELHLQRQHLNPSKKIGKFGSIKGFLMFSKYRAVCWNFSIHCSILNRQATVFLVKAIVESDYPKLIREDTKEG